MKEGLKFKEVKRALRHNKVLADSPELGYKKKEHEWGISGVYDSSINDFGSTFIPLSQVSQNTGLHLEQQGKIFKNYIEDTLSQKEKQGLTAVEFGGPGSKLFEGFTKNFFNRTIGVCLKDIRDSKTKENDTRNNHSVIEGDILDVRNDDKLLAEVLQSLHTNKIDLIICRMVGPIKYIDKHPIIMERTMKNWYEILNENGLMFIQFQFYEAIPGHDPTTDLIKKWSVAIKEKYPEIDVQVINGALRLHKRIGSPEKLPSAIQVFK